MYRAMYLVEVAAGLTGNHLSFKYPGRPRNTRIADDLGGGSWRKATNEHSSSPSLLGSPSSVQHGLRNSPLGRRDASASVPEGYSQLPGLLTQRERAAFRQPRNPGDRRLGARVLFEFANVFSRPEAPRPPHLLLCHPNSLQLGTRRLS